MTVHFIGGGLTLPGLAEAAWERLAPGGRLVANAVTIEGQAKAAEFYARWGGALTHMQFSRADPLGRFHGFRPSMPAVQWKAVKP